MSKIAASVCDRAAAPTKQNKQTRQTPTNPKTLDKAKIIIISINHSVVVNTYNRGRTGGREDGKGVGAEWRKVCVVTYHRGVTFMIKWRQRLASASDI